MAMIPDDKLDEIRRAADIVDVISDYVRLIPSGRNYKAVSPFNPTEKTPSFYVSPEKQIYKCFSTGKGGNVFTFVQEMEKVGFIDAVKVIAKKAGIDLSPYQKAKAVEKESIEQSVMAFAAKFFFNALNSTEGKTGLDYFLSRGLTKDTITHFGLGYSFNSWDALYNEAVKTNRETPEHETVPLKLLEEFGLIAKSEKAGKHYDVFRARAMFPIFSPAGKVLGFGGRILTDEKETAKYINSPESRLYKKSEILYAMNFARDEIRRKNEAILVEGYMDVISLHQAGIKTAVASSGTSLTPDQVRLIGRLTKNVLFIYDGDKAGIKAMMRGIDIILEQGLSPKVLFLPDNDDPDSYVKKVGGGEFLKYAEAHKTSFLDFKLEVLRRSDGFSSPDKTSESIRELVTTLTRIPDELSREVYLKTLAEKTDLPLSMLQKEAVKITGRAERKSFSEPRDFPKRTLTDGTPSSETATPETPPKPVVSIVERTFLKSFLESTYHGSAVVEFVAEHLTLFRFEHAFTKTVTDFVIEKQLAHAGSEVMFNITDEMHKLPDDEVRNFVSELLLERPISERWQQETPSAYARRCLNAFLDATNQMNLAHFRSAEREIRSSLSNATENDESEKILAELQSVINKKNEWLAEIKEMKQQFGVL
jgi:DNA primase